MQLTTIESVYLLLASIATAAGVSLLVHKSDKHYFSEKDDASETKIDSNVRIVWPKKKKEK